MKSNSIYLVFLSTCVKNDTEKKIADLIGYKQPTVHQFLDQLVGEGFVEKKYKEYRIIEDYEIKPRMFIGKSVFYSPIYSKIVKMNIHPKNTVLREDWEYQHERESEKKKLMNFLTKKCEEFLKMIYMETFLAKDKDLKKFTLEDLSNAFLQWLTNYVFSRVQKKETKYVNEYIRLFFDPPPYLNNSY